MHFAAQSIPSSTLPRIIGLVMFGDPGNRGAGALDPLGGMSPAFPDALAGKLRENCAHNDPVCTNNGTLISAHLSYDNAGTTYMIDSAAYIQKQFETNGTAGAQPAPEGPGNQTDLNIAALQALGAALGAEGLKQTCNSTTTTTTAVPSGTQASGTAKMSATTATAAAIATANAGSKVSSL